MQYAVTTPNSPLTFTKKKVLFLSKLVTSFSHMVISHELGDIYLDISFFLFTIGR